MDGLKSFLFFNELSQQEIADYLGVSKGQMSKIASGTSRLQAEQLAKLLSNPYGWNTEFLTDPVWSDLEAGELASRIKNALSRDSLEANRSHVIPLIPIEVFAGPGEPAYEDERIEDHYTVSDFKESDFLLRVKGDSMVPKYNSGDIVACKKVDKSNLYFLQWGRVYVIYTMSQGAMIKRIQPSEKDGWITCVSENVKYAPFDVPMDDIVSIALVNGSISLE